MVTSGWLGCLQCADAKREGLKDLVTCGDIRLAHEGWCQIVIISVCGIKQCCLADSSPSLVPRPTRSFSSSVCVDNNTRMRKSSEERGRPGIIPHVSAVKVDVGGGGGASSRFSRLFIIQSARFERLAASRESQTIYTTLLVVFKLICGRATPHLRPLDIKHVMNTTRSSLFFAAPLFHIRQRKQKKPGRPGNEAYTPAPRWALQVKILHQVYHHPAVCLYTHTLRSLLFAGTNFSELGKQRI